MNNRKGKRTFANLDRVGDSNGSRPCVVSPKYVIAASSSLRRAAPHGSDSNAIFQTAEAVQRSAKPVSGTISEYTFFTLAKDGFQH